MMKAYRDIAFAIVWQAVADYFDLRHKDAMRYFQAYERLKNNEPKQGTEEHRRWSEAILKARQKYYKVKDADDELEAIKYSMEEGEIAKLLEILDFPMSGREMYVAICSKPKKPKQLRTYVVKMK